MSDDHTSYRNNEENWSPQIQKASSICVYILVSEEIELLILVLICCLTH